MVAGAGAFGSVEACVWCCLDYSSVFGVVWIIHLCLLLFGLFICVGVVWT